MKKFLLLCIALLLCALPACAELDIIATNFPLYDFARAVAGDAAQVSMLIAPGTEIHAYDPKPRDMIAVQECDMLLYVGGSSEGWVETMMAAVEGGPQRVRLMECVETTAHEHDTENEHNHSDGHDHGVLEFDEHIWTSPVNAMAMVDAVAEAMMAADAENAALYRANADAYMAEIAGLDAAFRELAEKNAGMPMVFADRFPMAYFAQEYGIEAIAAVSGCSADSDPSAQQLRAIIDTVREREIPCVYIIEMSNGRVAQTVQAETGCEIRSMHSCQNVTRDEMAAGETYVSLMRKNLEALSAGWN